MSRAACSSGVPEGYVSTISFVVLVLKYRVLVKRLDYSVVLINYSPIILLP